MARWRPWCTASFVVAMTFASGARAAEPAAPPAKFVPVEGEALADAMECKAADDAPDGAAAHRALARCLEAAGAWMLAYDELEAAATADMSGTADGADPDDVPVGAGWADARHFAVRLPRITFLVPPVTGYTHIEVDHRALGGRPDQRYSLDPGVHRVVAEWSSEVGGKLSMDRMVEVAPGTVTQVPLYPTVPRDPCEQGLCRLLSRNAEEDQACKRGLVPRRPPVSNSASARNPLAAPYRPQHLDTAAQYLDRALQEVRADSLAEAYADLVAAEDRKDQARLEEADRLRRYRAILEPRVALVRFRPATLQGARVFIDNRETSPIGPSLVPVLPGAHHFVVTATSRGQPVHFEFDEILAPREDVPISLDRSTLACRIGQCERREAASPEPVSCYAPPRRGGACAGCTLSSRGDPTEAGAATVMLAALALARRRSRRARPASTPSRPSPSTAWE